MKRTFIVMFVLLAALTTILLLAQEKISTHGKMSVSSIEPGDQFFDFFNHEKRRSGLGITVAAFNKLVVA